MTSVLPSNDSRTAGQGAQAFEKKTRSKLTDEQTAQQEMEMSKEAERQSAEFQTLSQKSGARRDRPVLWANVRKNVKKSLAPFYDEEITDEITEKLVEAAEHDPYFNRLFNKP